ncbi:hypothetical protein OTU49_012301, partial [Cherax quadricarinatus]
MASAATSLCGLHTPAGDIPFADADPPETNAPPTPTLTTHTYCGPRAGASRAVGGAGPVYYNTTHTSPIPTPHTANTRCVYSKPLPAATVSLATTPAAASTVSLTTTPALTRHHSYGGLAVVEGAGGAVRVATDRPHLVSMGSGRLSTAITLHTINEGRTVVGAGGMGVVPDIVVMGAGVEAEHCILHNVGGVVTLTPIATGVTIDGVK